jgi:hypothetical protein
VLWTGGRGRSTGPWWPAAGAKHTGGGGGRPGGAASGDAMGADWELPAAALQCTETRSEGTSGRGLTRQARWRAYLREMTTAKRRPTAAAQTRARVLARVF